MSFFSIDGEKCRHDGICAAECPYGLLRLETPESPPVPVEGAEEKCIRCGHCVAVCPHGAFSLEVMKSSDCPPVRKDMALGIGQVEHFLRSRRSIRTYQDKAVEPEKLSELIGVARYAPTGVNSQNVRWTVVPSRETVKKLSGMVIDLIRHMIKENHPAAAAYGLAARVSEWESGRDIVSRGAPVLVITHAPKEYGLAQVDCAGALTYLDLAAPSFGLGTCWAGFFMMAVSQWQPLQQALSFPEGNACFGAMMIGYPKYTYHRLPLRKEADIAWLGL